MPVTETEIEAKVIDIVSEQMGVDRAEITREEEEGGARRVGRRLARARRQKGVEVAKGGHHDVLPWVVARVIARGERERQPTSNGYTAEHVSEAGWENIEIFADNRVRAGRAVFVAEPRAGVHDDATVQLQRRMRLRVGELKNRPSLADRWGDMRDSERKKIMADVQNTMPPQYRKMLEEYYKKLGKADRK